MLEYLQNEILNMSFFPLFFFPPHFKLQRYSKLGHAYNTQQKDLQFLGLNFFKASSFKIYHKKTCHFLCEKGKYR